MEMSPETCARSSPAGQEIRTCGSANSSAPKRSDCSWSSRIRARSPVSFLAVRTRVRISRIAATTVKPSRASAVASTASSCRLKSSNIESVSTRSAAFAGSAGSSAARAPPSKPLRANEVHDNSVRRIDTITPDIVAPRPHEFARSDPRRTRIKRQYPHRDSSGKSPDREREGGPTKMPGVGFQST